MISIKDYLNQKTRPEPLAFLRIGFGLLMFFSIVRFYYNGWIESIYIEPFMHFKYYGFEWVKSLGQYNYLLFIICGVSSLFVALGYKYRFSIFVFFISFTYIELIDKTTYLNHYYFISVISFLFIFLPLNAKYSLDNYLNEKVFLLVPKWNVDAIKLFVFIVYFYAGLAKINSDWLLHAAPLSLWLTSNYDLPILGDLFQKSWVHYFFSWGGMLYDLLIPFFLIINKTRIFAFLLVILFHVMTAILFPIGMFPYIMILFATIFFSSYQFLKIFKAFESIKFLKTKDIWYQNYNSKFKKINVLIISILLFVQILFPFRNLMYSGELFWNEEGYRFSWRVMLIEKMGYTTFRVIDSQSDKRILVENSNFLTDFQIKQMSFQPDMILEYAHFLGNYYKKRGFIEPKVFVDSYVTLNGRESQRFIDNNVNLLEEKESFKKKNWIIPLKDEIKGI